MAKILEYIQQAKQIADTMDNVVLKSIIVDLQSEILDLQQENIRMKEELAKRDELKPIFENNMYYIMKSDGTKDGPYCSSCWDKDHKTIHMQRNNKNRNDYICPICRNYQDLSDEPQKTGFLGCAL
jgi:hypothetical protein